MLTMRNNTQRRRGGLTLVEVMLVLVILMIIASLAVTAYGPIQRKAYINASKTQIKAFKTPLEAYKLDMSDFPATADGLEALRGTPSGVANPVPLDPWGNPYQYEYPGKHEDEKPDIWSFGPDGMDNTDDDIGNWMTE
jgi:general secretion pathway protein G